MNRENEEFSIVFPEENSNNKEKEDLTFVFSEYQKNLF
ncbi:hypothetical protein bwei_5382 [Bacillus mycoides]|nr:hypothetical protein bwei_5382 [Bacillus mycoides]EEL03130.1 hypothetical protein bcere0014_52990 [Bacillus cereus BDRD-ST196]